MSSAADATPAELGYRFPAEWERHSRTWMAWPERPDNWREGAGPAREAYAAVARAIARFEPVTVFASPGAPAGAARAALASSSIEVVEAPLDDAWMRDIGPTFLVRDGEEAGAPPAPSAPHALAGVDWTFNAWGGLLGGLYATWDKDDAVASKVLELASARRFRTGLVLEGGSIHTDGQGTLLATEECLLNANRNPSLTREEIEAQLRANLSISKVVWIPRGLAGDTDTDGHVDNCACFSAPGRVLLAWSDDAGSDQGARCREALAALEAQTDARGRPFEVTKVPIPPPMAYTAEETRSVASVQGSEPREAGTPLAASYVNFYLVNGAVIAPQFGEAEADRRALEILAEAFPDREVVPVQTREILLGGGNIHCITQQQPAVVAAASVGPDSAL